MQTFYQVALRLLAITNFVKADFRDEALDAHNKLRRTHHVPDCIRNTTLDKVAQDSADELAKKIKKEKHHLRNGNYGENEFSYGSKRYISDSEAVQSAITFWYNGKNSYDYNKPEVVKGMAATFTQIVWKNTKSIGIGVARSSKSTYVCVDYDPPGNLRESFPENVLKP